MQTDKPVVKIAHLYIFSCTLCILCSIHACAKLGFHCVWIPYRSLRYAFALVFVSFTLTVLLGVDCTSGSYSRVTFLYRLKMFWGS
jgi:hypothetical protein